MNPPSALARLQQVGTLLVVAAGLAWLAWHWRQSPAIAVGGLLVLWFGYSLVLAMEFLALRFFGGEEHVPRPSWRQLARAWLVASWLNAVLFAWRQPFRCDAVPDYLPSASSRNGARGVVLVHGFVCNRGFWAPWCKELRRRRIPFVAVNLEPAFGSIDDYLATIDQAVQRMTAATGRAPVLVCHSMGGLAARAWLRTSGEGRAHHVITIGSPHQGTWFARFSRARSGRQMRRDAEWLRQLAAGAPDNFGARFTCWYSNCDNMVFPVSTATLAGADNRLVLGPGHVELAFHPEVVAGSLEKIAA